ncbi:MAG: hypothetical protein WCD56_20260, partial [Pseudolabrys sp.]
MAQIDVRLGLLADLTTRNRDVRFAPESRHSCVRQQCPLSANNAHVAGYRGLTYLHPGSLRNEITSCEILA